MHIGSHSFGFQSHHTHHHNRVQTQDHTDRTDRATRLVDRLDQDNDGKLSPGELQDTRLGKRLSVDRFAKLDKNDDGLLEPGELTRGRRRGHAHRPDGPSQTESAVVAKIADQLAAPSEPDQPKALGEDIAKALLARLDKDDSGALNSEEIAGTKLAEKIGADFYALDGDKSGTLDTGELSAFITSQFLGTAAETPTEDVAPVPTTDDPVTVQETPATTDQTKPAVSTANEPGYADTLRASFEAALEILERGAEQQQSAMDAVRALYAEANKAFG